MYAKIKAQPSVANQYAQRLLREKLVTQADVERARRLTYPSFKPASNS